MANWRYHQTYSGTPQGGVISPLLANIYLHELDRFVENELLPAYNYGDRKARNPTYQQVEKRLYRASQAGDVAQYKRLARQRRTLASMDAHDPQYRRLRYIRYADDVLLGFDGPKQEALAIKEKLAVCARRRGDRCRRVCRTIYATSNCCWCWTTLSKS